MRIVDCLQRSEEWEAWRARPTCSDFGRFCTPAKGQYSSQADKYAAEIISKRIGTHTEPPPSFWMEWGMEHEDEALEAYVAHTGHEITRVGFVLPDDTDDYGGSPDALVLPGGVVEAKCPAPETLILWHHNQTLPIQHKAQVQGLLWVTGCEWCDFWGYHPGLKPFLLKVTPDLNYHKRLETTMYELLATIARMDRLSNPLAA